MRGVGESDGRDEGTSDAAAAASEAIAGGGGGVRGRAAWRVATLDGVLVPSAVVFLRGGASCAASGSLLEPEPSPTPDPELSVEAAKGDSSTTCDSLRAAATPRRRAAGCGATAGADETPRQHWPTSRLGRWRSTGEEGEPVPLLAVAAESLRWALRVVVMARWEGLRGGGARVGVGREGAAATVLRDGAV